LVIDPWGEVLLNAGSKEGLYFTNIDPNKVVEARTKVPVFKDRVPALYSHIIKEV